MGAREQLIMSLQDALRGAALLEEKVVVNILLDAIEVLTANLQSHG